MYDIKKIKNASYNPRSMTKETKRALAKSMEEFEDISGIVLNKKTGNIVSGNHRWNNLIEKFGKGKLELKEISNNIYSIEADNEPTGFLMKTVDWDLQKEKAANIAANSDLLSGQFDSSLQDILSELNEGFDLDVFEALRFDELSIDLTSLDDDISLDGNSQENKMRLTKEGQQRNRDLEGAHTEEVPEVKIILTQVKLSVPGELEAEVRADLSKWLNKKHYKDEVKVL